METPGGAWRLSDVLGRHLTSVDGSRLGRVRDLGVQVGHEHPRVSCVLVVQGRDAYLVPWAGLARTQPSALVLGSADGLGEAVDRTRPPLAHDELLLGRDVLDSQVVDLEGRRLSRVAEVLLADRPDGLEVIAVDLGVAALLRRLGLGALVRDTSATAVDWSALHLTSPRGHALQLATAAAGVHRLDSLGLAELLARLPTVRAAEVVRTVGPLRASEALHRSHPQVVDRLSHAVADSGPPPPRRRRLLRSAGWRVHRPPGAPGRR